MTDPINAVETAWQELVTSALLGTERHPPSLSAAGGMPGSLLAGLSHSSPQHHLLQAAVILAHYRQAGRLPEDGPPVVATPCAPDGQERCASSAAARLAVMLGRTNEDLLPEWLLQAAAVQRRVPEELLPDFLEWGENHIDTVELLLPVLGARGRWLAAQLPWAEKMAAAVFAEIITPESAQAVWQVGRKAVRHFLLQRLRRTDPPLARALLASTWSEESADDRTVFLKILSAGLCPDDEPFLEAALDDRSKEVRKTAAALLACLPESRLVARQLQRLKALLKWNPGGFLRKPQLEIILPEACVPAMLRDGIEPKPPRAEKIGEKAWWLQQMLSAVPPSIWTREWKVAPAELLQTAANGDWKDLLYTGWSAAALSFRDAAWAEAFLRLDSSRTQMIDLIPAGPRETLVLSLLPGASKEGIGLLAACTHSWSPAFTRQAMQHLRGRHAALEDPSWQYDLQVSFHTIAQHMHLSLSAEAARIFSLKTEPGSAWEKAVADLLSTLEFRNRIHEELS